jgi:hypothetical protein
LRISLLVQTEELAGQLEDLALALADVGAAHLLVFSPDAYDVGLVLLNSRR